MSDIDGDLQVMRATPHEWSRQWCVRCGEIGYGGIDCNCKPCKDHNDSQCAECFETPFKN